MDTEVLPHQEHKLQLHNHLFQLQLVLVEQVLLTVLLVHMALAVRIQYFQQLHQRVVVLVLLL